MSPEPSDSFYVGYNARMPATFARRVRGAAAALLALAVLLPLLLIAAQGRFSSGAFEFDRTRVLEGRLAEFPYPALDVDADGAPPASYWLVGPGKHGAAALVRGLDGRRVRVRGSLIERDGEKMLQLVPGEIEIVGAPAATKPSSIVRIRTVTVVGELVDSKCHLGVMKPGEGPTHRDCAVRCLLGRIPPMFVPHDRPDLGRIALVSDAAQPFANPEGFAGRRVSIRGEILRRGAQKFLAVARRDIRVLD